MKLSDLLSNAPKGLWGGELKNGESGTPVIKTNNMTYEGQINFTDLTYRSIDNRDAVPNYLQNGDLLVEKSGGTKTHSVGYINYFDGENQKYVANNFIFVLRPNEQLVSPKYLFYQMKYKYESGQIRNCYEQTTGIQNLRVKSYLQKEVLCPSRTIQNDVVLSLDSIASAISIEKASLLLADELIKSRFNEQFINNPSFTTKKWYEVLNIINGRDYKGHEGTKYPIYGSGGFMGIYANNFLASGILTIIGRKGTIDRPLLVNGEIWNIDTAFAIKTNDEILNPVFFHYRSKFYDYQNLNKQTTKPSLRKSDLLKLDIEIPPMAIQLEFIKLVEIIDKLKFINKK